MFVAETGGEKWERIINIWATFNGELKTNWNILL